MKKSESLFFSKWHKTDSFSSEARLLQTIQNAIIASIPTKKGQEWRKKEALVQLPLPKKHSFTVASIESAAQVEKRWAEAGWGKLNQIYKKKNLG